MPSDLSDEILNTTMHSKSKKKYDKERGVVGKTVGRVQYSLNKVFVNLLDEGIVTQT